jgi:hypothetical protein
MNDEPIRKLLQDLPREKASSGFTGQVMSRLDEKGPPLWGVPRLALAGGLVMIFAVWIGVSQWQSQQDAEVDTRIQTLRSEIQQAQKDIMLLKEIAPILYLSGDKEVDFVLDLRHLVRDENSGNIQPASFEGSDRGMQKGEIPR